MKDRIKQVTEGLKDIASIGYRYGEFDSTHNKMNVPVESMGVIDSTMTNNGTLYAILRRLKNKSDYGKEHQDEVVEYYNCDGDVNSYSPFELLIPLSNINLKRDVINPLDLIGGKV